MLWTRFSTVRSCWTRVFKRASKTRFYDVMERTIVK
jgi:hypothetical protein